MTSYLRTIFGYGQYNPSSASGASTQSSSRSKSHSRSRSSPTNYIYAQPGTTSSSTSSRPSSSKRSNSYNTSRTTAPSPLRYTTNDQNAVPAQVFQTASSTGSTRHHSQERSGMYRRASYKPHEHSGRPIYTPSVSFSSSHSNSSSSLYPGSHHSGHTSSSRPRYTEPNRPPLTRSQGSGSYAGSSSSAHGHSTTQPHQYAQQHHHTTGLRMHPLLAATRLHNAPISYDVLYTPSVRTVLDRTTHLAVPATTLSQPATDPPTTSRIVLRSHKFPWTVSVSPSSTGSRFYIGSSSKSTSVITNLDVLNALHAVLLTRVTPDEWESLGHGSRAQRKVTRAYEKRCTRMGGGWEGGVRRIDWLGKKTRLVGIEVDKHTPGVGKLVFGKA